MTYSSEVMDVHNIAESLAKENSHGSYGAPHLMRALMMNEIGLASLLVTWGIDINYLKEWADIRIENYPKNGKMIAAPSPDKEVEKILEVAEICQLKLNEPQLSPVCLLMALCKNDLAFSKEQLKSLPISEQVIIENSLQNSLTNTKLEKSDQPIQSIGNIVAGSKYLDQYCIDKTDLALHDELDPIVGRDTETRMMMEVLSRRSKPNVIIVGEPGVGKTALVEGFAQEINSGEVPDFLKTAKLLELDLGALIAGASYKGEVEDRMKKIIGEIKQFEKAILFIDEIHLILDPNGGLNGMANLLKPELARRHLTVIGATTIEEYRKFIEPDAAFSRRFELLEVKEPDAASCLQMLKVLVPKYQAHHELEVADEVMQETIYLASRYIPDRRLPDIAIDLTDRTMAALRLINDRAAIDLQKLSTEFKEIKKVNVKIPNAEALKSWNVFFLKLKNSISPILFSRVEVDVEFHQLSDPKECSQTLETLFSKLEKAAKVKVSELSKTDVAAIVADSTGIPLGKLQTKEKERLLNMEDHLKKRVVGQDHALKTIAEAVVESRSGLQKANQPIGSFFFLGPTGTGKTELAKSMAEFLFNDENALIRFDMSEFKESHSAALLYGAPPGYVGYKEGGLLVNKIRQKPYSIVLFDEIEKAHSSVFDIFLQILDEGRLTDKLGREGDFSNAIILFTSNIGSQYIIDTFKENKIPTHQELLEKMSQHFRPEFLGRLTEVLPFAPINEDSVTHIFKIQLRHLERALSMQGVKLILSEAATKALAMEGFTPEYGARPLRGVIRNRLRQPISRKLIAGEIKKGDAIHLDWKKDDLVWEIKPLTKN